MMKHLNVSLLSCLVLAAAACGSSGSAGGAAAQDETVPPSEDGVPLGAGPFVVGTIDMTVSHPDFADVRYSISCLGDTATITPPTEGLFDSAACQALSMDPVLAYLANGPDGSRACTEIYGGPDTATITGTIDDEQVDFTLTRKDGCAIDDWALFDAVLPAPRS